MEQLLFILIFFIIEPFLCFYFFSKYIGLTLKWYQYIPYFLFTHGLFLVHSSMPFSQLIYILIQISLLAFCGIILLKCNFISAITTSSLIISVLCISNSTTGLFISIYLQAYFSSSWILPAFFFHIVAIVIFGATLWLILQDLQKNINCYNQSALFLLLIPTLSISLTIQAISDAVYGNTIVIDEKLGFMSPQINIPELLIIQFFSYIGLMAALITYKKLMQSMQKEYTIKFLEQQTQAQEIYIQEAQFRYEQTRSFRHDIKNHLLTIESLLQQSNMEEAQQYLSGLNEMSDTLSFPCQTGNATVNALLESKLSMAKQQHIFIECSIHIPESSLITNIDWCIILSNAIDNAIKANQALPPEKRFIHILGKQKGNFYSLHIENPCESIVLPLHEGIGLSNIKAVVNKYHGTIDIEASNNLFKLNILFIISQP